MSVLAVVYEEPAGLRMPQTYVRPDFQLTQLTGVGFELLWLLPWDCHLPLDLKDPRTEHGLVLLFLPEGCLTRP